MEASTPHVVANLQFQPKSKAFSTGKQSLLLDAASSTCGFPSLSFPVEAVDLAGEISTLAPRSVETRSATPQCVSSLRLQHRVAARTVDPFADRRQPDPKTTSGHLRSRPSRIILLDNPGSKPLRPIRLLRGTATRTPTADSEGPGGLV